MKKNLLATVLYEKALPFLDDLINSINKQSSKNFEVLYVLDSIEKPDLLKNTSVDFQVIQTSGTITQTREFLLTKSQELGFENIILVDADDILAANRIEVVANSLENYDIVLSDLWIFNSLSEINLNTSEFSKGLNLNKEIAFEDIISKNYFGLTNTAFKLSILGREHRDIPSNIIAYDWALFSKLLLKKPVKAIFNNQTWTFYRSHESNIALKKKETSESILKALSIKLSHYELMKNISSSYNEVFVKTKKLFEELRNDMELMNDYLLFLSKRPKSFNGWWDYPVEWRN